MSVVRGKKKGTKGGVLRSRPEIDLHRAELPTLIRQGWSQQMVAEKWGVSRSMVAKTWGEVVREMRGESRQDLDDLIQERLEQYAMVKREAWDQWNVSNLPIECIAKDGSPMPPKSEPDQRYLQIVLSTIDSECNLLGLNVPKRREVVDLTTAAATERFLEELLPAVKDALEVLHKQRSAEPIVTPLHQLQDMREQGITAPAGPPIVIESDDDMDLDEILRREGK